MKPFFSLFLFAIAITATAFAKQADTLTNRMAINNFLVKEHLLKNEKIAIIACDGDEKPLENINGVFQFSINGFKQELKFNDGVATAPQPINESTFIYLRHKNESGSHGKLFYVLKTDSDLKPVKISWWLLALVPLVLILIAMAFRKLLIYAVIILAAIFYFNSSNGLSIPTFFDTIFDGLKSFF